MGILGILYRMLSILLECYLKFERCYFIMLDDKISCIIRVKFCYKYFEINLKYFGMSY